MAGSGHGTKAVLAALLANAGIALAKFGGFLITGSASMLAESVHSAADTGNQGLLLLGGKKARRAATPQHPFGYGRERYFWSFVVAVMLFSVGGMFATYEGIEKIRHPHELESPGIAVGILLLAILLESFSFRTAIVEANHIKEPKTSWWSFIRRSKQPELPVVLLEDLGALVGLVIALAAVATSIATDEPVFDAIGTLSIGILLIVIASILAIEMKGLLIGESASATDQQAIAAAIEIEPSVKRLIHMRTEHLGPDELLVAAKIELLDGLDVAEVTDIVNRVESSIRRAVPSARVIYLEPDIFRTTLPAEFDMPPAAEVADAEVADAGAEVEVKDEVDVDVEVVDDAETEAEAPMPPPPPPPPPPAPAAAKAHEEALVEPD
jgi:cation diffusion facilitator family transporter